MKPMHIVMPVIGAFAILAMSAPAQASRPLKPVPAQWKCAAYLHSATKKAKRKSRARRRARRNWATRALGRAGFRRRKRSWAWHTHYDCSKKGKWHHCQAAGYPCPKFREAIGGSD